MGRRALRKIDPSLDLTGYLRALEDLPQPWAAEELFGRSGPLEVEVGSGKGLFLETAAEAHPERNYLGVEISRKYARFAAARLAKHQLTNAVLVCGDALRLFADFLPAAAVSAVHIYFPDPWWKKRHHKRRLMKAKFLRDVERVLVPGGKLHFWTDVLDYFHSTLEVIAAETSLAGPRPVEERPAEHDLDFQTHFERRMRLHRRAVYRAEFRAPGSDGRKPVASTL